HVLVASLAVCAHSRRSVRRRERDRGRVPFSGDSHCRRQRPRERRPGSPYLRNVRLCRRTGNGTGRGGRTRPGRTGGLGNRGRAVVTGARAAPGTRCSKTRIAGCTWNAALIARWRTLAPGWPGLPAYRALLTILVPVNPSRSNRRWASSAAALEAKGPATTCCHPPIDRCRTR